MYPELFEIPFLHLTVKSYGFMMVIGFLAAISIIRHLSRDITPDPQLITNAALYSLIAGVLGARLFFVLHHFDQFRGNLLATFAIWKGGLELLGGVMLAIPLIFFYLVYHRLPIRKYLDILAIGLMLALVFGRIGCFLNGCCYGKPTNLPWGVHFPYGSFAYVSQINSNPERNRAEPQLKLPRDEYLGYIYEDGKWYPKAYEDLTDAQQVEVTKGKYRCLPVHPTQLYSSASGGILCLVLYLCWRRSRKAERVGSRRALLSRPGSTFALMLILYGIVRFLIEFVRDDNPYELAGLTISQLINIGLVAFGLVLMVSFQKAKGEGPAAISWK